jgi:hypothetical protein
MFIHVINTIQKSELLYSKSIKKITFFCDLYVKSATLQMTAQDPNIMIARVFNHLPLALKLSVSDKNFVNYVKKLVSEHLFYDKFEFFGHNFE